MKRNGTQNKQEQKLKRRLELVRTTIRELTPGELDRVNGGTESYSIPSLCDCPPYTNNPV